MKRCEGKGKYKGPEAETSFRCWRNNRKASELKWSVGERMGHMNIPLSTTTPVFLSLSTPKFLQLCGILWSSVFLPFYCSSPASYSPSLLNQLRSKVQYSNYSLASTLKSPAAYHLSFLRLVTLPPPIFTDRFLFH